jgi:large subunit ribosomal protein L30
LLSKEELASAKFLTDKAMAKITITQIRSAIDRTGRQKKTIQALGLGKIRKTVTVENTPQIAGMVKSVQHLLEVKEA